MEGDHSQSGIFSFTQGVDATIPSLRGTLPARLFIALVILTNKRHRAMSAKNKIVGSKRGVRYFSKSSVITFSPVPLPKPISSPLPLSWDRDR